MIVETRLNILIRSNRLDAARAEFSRLLAETQDPAVLSRLFDVTPALYEGWRRTAAWLALRERVEALARSGDPVEQAADAPLFEALPLRLDLALRDCAAFLAAMRTLRDEGRLGPRDRRLRAVADALATPRGPSWSAPKIFGVGLSKTGTTTLASALTTLGYNTLDWRNPLTMELMGEDDLHLFDAFTDTPVCVRFEEYYYMFPNAKFIYTVRPLPSWRESISRHWRRHRGLGDFDELKAALVQPGRFHYGATLRDIEQSLYFQYADFAQAYRVHDRRVRRFFADKPDGRFLVFDLFAGDGWTQLCAFLGVPAPNEAFPWTNRDPSARPRPAEAAAAAPSEGRMLAALGRRARALIGRLAARDR